MNIHYNMRQAVDHDRVQIENSFYDLFRANKE
jgi:hypothetical protein